MTAPPLQPGLYVDVPAEEYHADPALSSSGARALLPPSCPAAYRWARDQAATARPRRHFDIGHAAHLAVLGAGDPIHVVDAADWRTKAAQAEAKEARAQGCTPILTHEHEAVCAMADAIRAHPVANTLLNPDIGGQPEVSLVWDDTETGTRCRARFDWLPPIDRARGRRLIIPDYKTCASAEPDALSKAMQQHGYHQQAAWYLEAAVNVLGANDPAFVFICQEKAPPYLVTIFEPDPMALRIGHGRNRWARMLHRDCTASGVWPAYSTEIELIGLPLWAENQQKDVTQL